MGRVKGQRSGPKTHTCRRCGEPILFAHRFGFIRRGEPKFYPVNADDHQPHSRRCQILLGLKAAKKAEREARRTEKTAIPESPQKEMF